MSLVEQQAVHGQVAAPSPLAFFATCNAFQRTEALRAALELGVFTAIGAGARTAAEVAAACGAAERGARILCDFLTIHGLLAKRAGEYHLTPDSAAFLDQRSPMYVGGAVEFLVSSTLTQAFGRLAEAVRRGGTALDGHGSMEPEHPMWVQFARAMGPLMMGPAQGLAEVVGATGEPPRRVLDIAAGHGRFGLALAQRWPQAEVTAVDWAPVLAVARENAAAAGVADRFHERPGSAFDVDLGEGYDVVLLTNFVHHFDPPTNEALLRRLRDALAPGGRVAALDFVPHDDRVSPPGAADFSLVMLATTERGDAYTFAEWERMYANAGLEPAELHPLPGAPMAAVVGWRPER